jgi:hypothetical protein
VNTYTDLDTLIAQLQDLLKQATTERSHYYVASCCNDAIAALEQMRAAALAKDPCSGQYREYDQLVAERNVLRAELEAAKRDAERYRWLRMSVANPVYCAQSTEFGVKMVYGTYLDKIIDARAQGHT